MTTPRRQPKQPKKKPLGNPIEWNDNDLDHLSHITPADLKAANALWSNEAPPPLKMLLQADVQEEAPGGSAEPV
jgi:hypothetical protein